MSFELETIVPWGRNLAEYLAMFGIGRGELKDLFILDCGGGPSSFSMEVRHEGGRAVSCDPLYISSCADIEARIRETFDLVMEQTRRSRENFRWDRIKDTEELGQLRMAAMAAFLSDFDAGRRQGRYMDESLPKLPFADRCLDLALSSHFLFLYEDKLDLAFHTAAIMEMCRVADEARIFPVVNMRCQKSAHLEPVMAALEDGGYSAELVKADYEFQKGACEMLRVKREDKG